MSTLSRHADSPSTSVRRTSGTTGRCSSRSCTEHTQPAWPAPPPSAGFEGYGGTNHIHTVRLLSLSEDLPVAVTIIDTPERIDAFLPTLDEVMTGGMATLEDVEVIHYSSQTPPHRFSWGLGAGKADLTAST